MKFLQRHGDELRRFILQEARGKVTLFHNVPAFTFHLDLGNGG